MTEETASSNLARRPNVPSPNLVRAAPSHGEGSGFESQEDDQTSRSSVGLECHFDIVEVEGSIPSVKTIFVENSLYLGRDVLYNYLCHLMVVVL